jgi:predicted GNAT family acetyltransferase
MARGPFNFPRVTSIGPFAESEASQEFKRETDQHKIMSLFLNREIMTIHDLEPQDAFHVDAKLVVREEVDEDAKGPLETLQTELELMNRDTDVASMTYWMKENICSITGVEVKEDFRNMGIATTLKRQELEYMEEQGVEIVYTDVISEGGYRLAKRTDFKPIHQADHLRGTDAQLTFQNNRGMMFKSL